jgi:gluconate 2-dehydrogenase gamma chain
LTAAELAFIDTMVNAVCPADDLTPDGVTCGLAAGIEQHLVGESHPPGRRAMFAAGVDAADEACRLRLGVPFRRLSPHIARQFLRDLAAGDLATDFPLASWFSETVNPLLTQACFSGAVYDSHGSRVFWKLFA